MANPLDDALASLQMPKERGPQDIAARNAALINQFNHANAHERMMRNHEKVNPPNYDALMQKLHGIDAQLMLGRMVDKSRFRPDTLRMAQVAQMTGKPDLAYQILNEENRKIISRDAIGGAPLSTMAWEKLRHNAGIDAVKRHHAEESSDTGPVQIPGGVMREQMLSSAMASPSAKDDLYRLGVEAFDRQFGKHKRYLVEDNLAPNSGTVPHQQTAPMQQAGVAPSTAPGAGLPPGIESIVHNAGVIGQQQAEGAPAIPPPQFAKVIGAES